MNITLYSLVTTVLWTSLLSLLILIGRRSTLFIQYCGIHSLFLLLLCYLLRLLFPIELLFATEVVFPNLLNPISEIVHINVYPEKNITILTIVFIIGTSIAVVLLVRFSVLYSLHIKWISRLPSITTNQINKIAKAVISDKHRKKIKVIPYPMVTVPMICGFNKRYILLPMIDYTDEELFMILHHEYTHFKNWDSYLLVIVELFCACFWWNPFVHLIKRELNYILEIKCDRKVIQGYSKKDIILYTEIMLKFLTVDSSKINLIITSAFCNEKAIKQRFELLLEPCRNDKLQKISVVFTTMILVGILMLSYLFVFQSQYEVEYAFEINSKASYLEQNEDGTYTVYSEKDSYVISAEYYNVMIANGILINNNEKEREE